MIGWTAFFWGILCKQHCKPCLTAKVFKLFILQVFSDTVHFFRSFMTILKVSIYKGMKWYLQIKEHRETRDKKSCVYLQLSFYTSSKIWSQWFPCVLNCLDHDYHFVFPIDQHNTSLGSSSYQWNRCCGFVQHWHRVTLIHIIHV